MICVVYAEDLLAAVANATGIRIGIAADRLHNVIAAGMPADLFTTDMGSTRIRWAAHAVFKYSHASLSGS